MGVAVIDADMVIMQQYGQASEETRTQKSAEVKSTQEVPEGHTTLRITTELCGSRNGWCHPVAYPCCARWTRPMWPLAVNLHAAILQSMHF
jgi:hypothetical protein